MNAPATAIDFDRQTVEVSDQRLGKLRIFNLVMGLLHLISGSLMVVLGNDFALDISTFNLNGPPGTPIAEGSIDQVSVLPLASATAAFLFLSAFFHFLIASPIGFRAYVNELRRGRNRFRWVEYSLSSTLMIVLIALITGITDLAALIAIAFVNASMILFGWIMEMVQSRRPAGLVDTVLVRMRRRYRALGRDRHLPRRERQPRRRRGPPGLRLRDHRDDLRPLQHLRRQPVAPVPPDRQVDGLHLRRDRRTSC